MTSPTLPQIVEGLSEEMRDWIVVTPLQQPVCAGYIGHLAAKRRHKFDTGHSFANFARKRGDLFQRLPGQNGTWAYRLTILGTEVRTHLLSLGEGM